MKSLWLYQQTPAYSRIDELEDVQPGSIGEGESPAATDRGFRRWLRWKSQGANLTRLKYWPYFNIGLFILSMVIFIRAYRLQSAARSDVHSMNFILKQTSMPSPILDSIDIPIKYKRMDATLIESDPLSIFRREPSAEVDHAWGVISDGRPIPLSREDVLAIGKDPKEAIRIPESWGVGSETYAGRVDVFHQIHCLDALRREAYFEHYYGKKYPGGFNETTAMHRLHLSHCVYYLLQNIMCNANTDVYTHFWTDTLETPFPDFNINHKCRDFDAVLGWQQEHALDGDGFVALRKPDSYSAHVMSHRFKEVHSYFLLHEDDGDITSGEIG